MRLQQTLSKVITSTNEIFEAEAGSVALLEPSGKELLIKAAVGSGAGAVLGIKIPVDRGVIGWVVTHNTPAVISDVSKDERFFSDIDKETGFATKSILCAPLRVNNRVTGALELMNMHPRFLSDNGLKILSVIADHAALAIENTRLFEEIRKAENNYRELFDNANDFIFTLNRNFRVSQANLAVLEKLGYRRNEIVGMPITQFVQPENIERLFRQFKNQLANSGAPTIFDFTILSKQKEEIQIEVAVRVQRQHQRNVALQCIARDVTQRHLLEKQLRQTEKLSTIGKLVAGVAHELNNPLTSIVGYASMLQEEEMPQRFHDDLQVIFRQAERARVIVRGLLAFAKNITLETEPVNINDVIQSALALMQPQLEHHNIQVNTSLQFGLPLTVADPHQLEQVFVNLITNSVHALNAVSGVRVLTITAGQSGGNILASVADNGPGIPEKILNKIFDPFFSTKQVGQGIGLGLSICYGIIGEHNGRIWADTAINRGTTFFIELPIIPVSVPAPAGVPAETSPASSVPDKALQILAVDDEDFLLALLDRVLSRHGHRVDRAASGQIALQKLTSNSYDVIISDVLMPDITGPELYQQVAKSQPDMAGRFIFITGNTVDLNTRSFLDKSGLPWLAKPFLPSDIEQAVNKIVAVPFG